MTAAVVVLIPVEVNADSVLALRGPRARSRPSNASTLQRLVEVNLKEGRSYFGNICFSWFAGPITIAVTTAAGVVVVADSITQLAVVVLSASWPGNGAHGSLRSTQTQILVPVTEELVTREALSRDGCMVQGFKDCEWLGVKETPEVVSVHLPNKSSLEAVIVCIASFQTCRVLILVGDPIPVLVGKGCLIASILVPIQIVIYGSVL